MPQHIDIAIIGGGIIGCSIAYYLAKENLSVHLFERHEIASGATRAAGGMLGAHSEYLNDTFFSFARESQALYKKFLRDTGSDIGYTTGGILQFARSYEEKIQLSRWRDADYLSPEQISIHTPHVAPPAFGAFLFKDDVHVHPEKACIAFGKAAELRGAILSEHAKVDAIEVLNDGFRIRSGEIDVVAAHVVIASAAASDTFIPGLRMDTVKGQCMQIDAADITLPYTLFDNGHYIVPRPDATFVIGATMENDSTDLHTTKTGDMALNDIAEQFIPGLSRLPVLKRWAGLRPKTVDDLPYIGRMHEKENIYLAAGHFRNGILLAPATACMIRDMIVGNEVNTERIDAFNPIRGIFHGANNRVEWQRV